MGQIKLKYYILKHYLHYIAITLLLIQILMKEGIIMKKKLLISTLLVTGILASATFISPITSNAKTIGTKAKIIQPKIDYEFTECGYVTGNEVSVRADSNTDSEVYGYLYADNNDVVTIIDNTVENGFYLIKNPFGSGYAYISTDYVSEGSVD
ncbi:SH3 domain-containing protein [Clostridium acetobutylicum]|uniref:Predicted membrane protein n=2 Tax=Clostridiaceae TaxID=31979 RepID=Q97FN5_CLOAB|nr:Predicted membrane protein [Clostridium acetobutylicum ATCC 824]AEI32502.1 hypothetical protein SMB_G2728 [Clostridium acetobutylicum DSM 1731]AWV78943.1 SH3 domain-containing protein [Clostridium acetobutylicum]PSM06904.1 SH3 domain-containing protein [Clostridium sp. NJ4]MBC2395182.1 SH3 domain-containing protein [Clostridium acetobutylicum]